MGKKAAGRMKLVEDAVGRNDQRQRHGEHDLAMLTRHHHAFVVHAVPLIQRFAGAVMAQQLRGRSRR